MVASKKTLWIVVNDGWNLENYRKTSETSKNDGWTDVLAKSNNSDFLAIWAFFGPY